MHVGYLVSRFPSTTETFIAREMAALRELGLRISLFTLVEQRDVVVQPEARQFLDGLQVGSLTSRPVIAAQLRWLARRPGRYLGTWARAVAGNSSSPRFLLRALAVVPAAAWFAQRCEADGVEHVHAHWATHSALAAWVVHELTDLPYSVTAHAHDIYVDQTMLGRKLAGASHVVVISDYNRRYLVERFPELEDRLHVVRCGVDVDRFDPTEDDTETSSGTGTGVLQLLCIASLQEYKGHIVALRALALLKATGISVRLTAVGSGELRADLAAAARRLDVADLVDWRGALPSDDVARLLRHSDVVVLPSIVTRSGKTEGIPVALMEAAAAQLPVIASDVSGIGELVEHGVSGLLTPPGDPVALADAITTLTDPALRARMGAAGRARVDAEFGTRRNAELLRELLVNA